MHVDASFHRLRGYHTLTRLRDFHQVAEVQGQSVRYHRAVKMAYDCVKKKYNKDTNVIKDNLPSLGRHTTQNVGCDCAHMFFLSGLQALPPYFMLRHLAKRLGETGSCSKVARCIFTNFKKNASLYL